MFAGCSDNSYAGFLGQYTSAGGNGAPPLTLIRGREVAKHMKALTDKIETISFPELFRDVMIPKRKPTTTEMAAWAMHANQPSVSSVTNGMSNLIVRTPSTNSATTNATTTSASNTTKSSISGTPSTTTPPLFIWQNVHGQRLDPPLGTIDMGLANALKKRKLCNYYHLRGSCESFHCAHDHDGKLNEEEKKTLRYVARSRPCQSGLFCEDPKCPDGHKCAFGEKCTKPECWFSNEMHEVSNEGQTRVVVEAPRKLIHV
jgi:hypothetical protein